MLALTKTTIAMKTQSRLKRIMLQPVIKDSSINRESPFQLTTGSTLAPTQSTGKRKPIVGSILRRPGVGFGRLSRQCLRNNDLDFVTRPLFFPEENNAKLARTWVGRTGNTSCRVRGIGPCSSSMHQGIRLATRGWVRPSVDRD